MREIFPVDLAQNASDELLQLRLGWYAGVDPPLADEGARSSLANPGEAGDSVIVVTSSASRWNFRFCKRCGHTFRRGDRVLIGPDGIFHLAASLHCADVAAPGQAARAAADGRLDPAELSAGVEAEWPAKAAVRQLKPDDWRLAAPGPREHRPTCLVCGHTFRVGEFVVVCPCRPDSPKCGGTVHRDPAAGLTCWENWRPTGEVTICPVIHRPVYELSDG